MGSPYRRIEENDKDENLTMYVKKPYENPIATKIGE